MDNSPNSDTQQRSEYGKDDDPSISNTNDSAPSVDSLLRLLFEKESEVRRLKEEQDLAENSQDQNLDENGYIESGHTEHLQKAKGELKNLREEAERRGLDIEEFRYRNGAPEAVKAATHTKADKIAPVEDWANQIDPRKPMWDYPPRQLAAAEMHSSQPRFMGASTFDQQLPDAYNMATADTSRRDDTLELLQEHVQIPTKRNFYSQQPPPPRTHYIEPAPMPQPQSRFPQAYDPFPHYGQNAFNVAEPWMDVHRGPLPMSISPSISDRTTNWTNGFRSRETWIRVDNQTEIKHREHRSRRKPKEFFKVGQVFETLWTEPCREISSDDSSDFKFRGNYGEHLLSEIRYFIVIKEFTHHCIALMINSYNDEGAAHPGVTKSEHGIVYTGDVPPFEHPSEWPRGDERGMHRTPIRVDPKRPNLRLKPMSRINYAKLYTIEHWLKVKSFGSIESDSLVALIRQFQAVQYPDLASTTAVQIADSEVQTHKQ